VLVCDTSLKCGECLVASNSPFKVWTFCEAEKTKESKIDTTRQRTYSQVLGKPTLLLLRRQVWLADAKSKRTRQSRPKQNFYCQFASEKRREEKKKRRKDNGN
jgi:hypothetical protein